MKFPKLLLPVFCILCLSSGRLPAQVTMSIGQNFLASTYGVNTSALPPDCNGSIGPLHFVELINGEFAIFNKTNGAEVYRNADVNFWANAGVTLSASQVVTDPRVIYDPLSQRWFATMVDVDGNATDPTLENNDFLFAVSTTSDPTGTWHGFKFIAAPSQVAFADFPTLGVDSNAVYISGDFFHGQTTPIGAGLVSIPKADLLLTTPTITNRTWHGIANYSVRGQVYQPVMCLDGTSSGNVVATGDVGTDPINYSNVFCFSVVGAGAPNARITNVNNIAVAPYTVPENVDFGYPLFTPTQPDGTSALEANDARFAARVYGVNGVLYAVHNTEINSKIAIRWYRISAATHALLESGTIADPNMDLFFPAIGANAYGTVVIGYNACGTGTTADQNVSCWAVAGQTVSGVTTFGTPLLLQAGATSYHGDDEVLAGLLGTPPYSRWGDYNAISMDPNDPTRFWTIIMFPSDSANNDVYSTQVTELITSLPQPILSIAQSGANAVISWSSSFGGFTLQENTSISSPLTWTTVPQGQVTNGNTISVTVSANVGRQFFRLKK